MLMGRILKSEEKKGSILLLCIFTAFKSDFLHCPPGASYPLGAEDVVFEKVDIALLMRLGV